MKHLRKLLLLALALCFPPSFAQEAPSPAPRSTAELKAAIEKIMRENRVPGLGIALVSHGKVEWQAGLGLADVAKKIPATDETLFRIGSISKGFVALAALKLQEEGKLKLSDTLKQWVPELAINNPWEATDPVRIAHLLEHTSGLDDISFREYAHNVSPPIPLRAALDLNAPARKARWRPGSRMAYSNAGPALVAYVIEKITGERFEDYVKRNFFVPLRMDSTTYFRPEGAGFAGQYASDGITPYPYWNIAFRPSGAINASPKDMAHYLLFYLRRGRDANGAPLLQPASIERMENPETLPMAALGVKAGYGLCSYDNMESGFRFHGHDGGVVGAISEMMYLPEQDAGFAFMVNSGNPMAAMSVSKLLQGYLVQGLKPSPRPPAVDVPRASIAHYSGYYRNISPRSDRMRFLDRMVNIQKIVLTEKGMTTQSPFGGPIETWAAEPGGLFRKTAQPEPSLALLPDENGEVMIQSAWGTWRKVSAFSVFAPLAVALASLLLMLSSLLFALVWGTRRLAKQLPAPGPLRVRALPLAASLLFFAMLALSGVSAGGDPLAALGTPTAESVAILLAGIGFAIASAAGLLVAWRERHAVMNRVAYWHSATVSLAGATVAAYLLYWGMIGVPTWMM